MNRMPVENHDQLEQVLFDFEQEWFRNQEVDLVDFLPAESNSNYAGILSELVRSDMEFRSERGLAFDSNSYFSRFPLLTQSAELKKAIVFEEYRLRNAQGDSVSAASLGEKYGIDSTGWPEIQSAAASQRHESLSTQADRIRQRQIAFPSVGEKFENFELVGVLGEGAFGKVFLAQQGDLDGRLVVLKLTTAKTEEHRLLARLQHTNIVPIHSVHRSGEVQAICMPLLGVATLEDVLRQCGKRSDHDRASIESEALVETVNQKREMTVADTIRDTDYAKNFRSRTRLAVHSHLQRCSSFKQFAIEFIRQVADGLGYAHRRGIVHGDLKPANLLVDDDGNSVILDFHLGTSQQEDVGNLIGGTLPYMAPEHLRLLDGRKGELQPSADVYSAGVILYEVLTGELPYAEDLKTTFCLDELAVVKDVQFEIPKARRGIIGEDAVAIIETCLQPDPAKRFANGIELAQELERALESRPLQRASNGTIQNRVKKWARRHPRLSSGSAILAASTLIITATTIGLVLASSNLAKLKAVATSKQHIQLAQTLRPSLAMAAHGEHDPAFIEASFEQADQVLKQNAWTNTSSLRSQKYFDLLSNKDASAESMMAAESHFWLAEVCQKLAVTGHDQAYFMKALKHNELADSFWPDNQSKIALGKQKQLIESRRDATADPTIQAADITNSDNRLDRVLNVYLGSKHPSVAEKLYAQLVEEEPGDYLVWLMLGNACVDQNKFAQADAYFTVCHSMDKTSSLPLLYRAMSRLEQRRTILALKDFELAERLAPDDVTILLNHALALKSNREFESALNKLDRAIDLGAKQTRVFYQRSLLKRFLGDELGAKEDLATFMRTEPADEKSCITRGVRKIKSDPEEAIKDFERALEFNTASNIAYNNIAHVHSEILGDPKTAIVFMNQAIKFNSASPKLIAARGVLLARIGDRTSAITDAENALRLDPSADTKYRVAGIYAQTSKVEPGDAAKAISLFADAAFHDPPLVVRMMRTDPDLEPLGNNKTFTSLVDSLKQLFEARKIPPKKSN